MSKVAIQLFMFCVIGVSGFSRAQMWTVNTAKPLPAYDYHYFWDQPTPVITYVYPGERVLADTTITNGGNIHVYKQDGTDGIIPLSSLKPDNDTVAFKINYDVNMFPFSTDTSVYSRSFIAGWESIIAWMEYSAQCVGNCDTINVPDWTKRAYNGDSKALLLLLTNSFGDGPARGQYSFNNWKLINHWSDSALAEVMLNRWMAWNRRTRHTACICGVDQDATGLMCTCGFGPAQYMWYDIQTVFWDNDKYGLLNYYRLYYPLCYSLIVRDEKTELINGQIVSTYPSKKEFKEFRAQIRQ